ncbi:MAG: hypothetical protein Kow00109_22450 [Acidobacteriota bacterium]
MYSAYHRLLTLLEEQEKALRAGAGDKLDALAPQLERAMIEVTSFDLGEAALSPDQARELAEIIRRLQERTERNRQLWLEALSAARTANEQLQASRRYAASLGGRPTAGRRFSRSG